MNIAKLKNFDNGVQKYPRLQEDKNGNIYLLIYEKDGWIYTILVHKTSSAYELGDILTFDSANLGIYDNNLKDYHGKVEISLQNKYRIVEN